MSITALQIRNFRNLTQVDIAPCAGINVISGANGSGKTSLLEAIHYLGLGRSFRTSTSNRLIQYSTQKFNLYASVLNFNQQQLNIGIERTDTSQSRMRIAEKDINNVVDLAFLLPLRIINSNSHQLFEGGPSARRKYVDWGVFYHDDYFLTAWRLFERSLRQRNLLLKSKSLKNEIDAWTHELVKYGYEVHNLRINYIQSLLPALQQLAVELLELASFIEVNYSPGWGDTYSDYKAALDHTFGDEWRIGSTQTGPHRADLELSLDNVLMKHFLSRGQQKLLICAMILAQGKVFSQAANRQLIYLIDDLPAELDKESRRRLISLLAKQPSQVFITAIESDMITEVATSFAKPVKVFHVKQGQISE